MSTGETRIECSGIALFLVSTFMDKIEVGLCPDLFQDLLQDLKKDLDGFGMYSRLESRLCGAITSSRVNLGRVIGEAEVVFPDSDEGKEQIELFKKAVDGLVEMMSHLKKDLDEKI